MKKATMEERGIMMIPEAILEDIFTRLPALYFATCRCVCKSWNNLLRKPQVIQAHINRIKSKRESMSAILSTNGNGFFSTQFIYDELRAVVSFMSFEDVDLFGYGCDEVVASTDGLVLVQSVEENADDEEVKKLLLLNPTTQKIKVLPLPPLPYPSTSSIPDNSKFAIGYHVATNDYKVLLLWFSSLNGVTVDVYSVHYGSWNRAGTFPYDFAAFDSWVNFEGHIRWLMSSDFLDFNLGTPEFRSVALPSMIKDVSLRYVDEIADCLYCSPPGKSSGINVWVMVDDSWTKFTVQQRSSTKSYFPVCLLGKEQLVLFEEKQWGLFAEDADDEDDEDDEEDTENRLMIYNLQYRSCQVILLEMPEEGFSEEDSFSVECTYIETDISPLTREDEERLKRQL